MDRREMIKKAGAAFMGASVMGIPAFGQDNANNVSTNGKKKKLVVATSKEAQSLKRIFESFYHATLI